MPKRILIAGAAGRDFHDFNMLFREDEAYEVVCFTAAQIPNISDRRYPPVLSGPLYPAGIPIYPEIELDALIPELELDEVIFSYSDVNHDHVMHLASRALAAGADFRLVAPRRTMLRSSVPIISICAVRTGCGKSQTAKYVVKLLKQIGLKRIVAVRHPMPYGDLAAQAVQRFATYDDLTRHQCTIEEREEYEPYIESGNVVYAGIDYKAILRQAEAEADIIIWDGGNNDLPFFVSDFHLVLVDPHRPGDEQTYHPGETNLLRADAVLINKIVTANHDDTIAVQTNVRRLNPTATLLQAASPITVPDPTQIQGRRVLVVEDGPTLTHGEMAYGAGVIAAKTFGAAELIDPRPFAVGAIANTFQQYPDIGPLLPAMGYGQEQICDLEATIEQSDAELILIATPIDLTRLIEISKPIQRVRYDLQPIGKPGLGEVLVEAIAPFLGAMSPGANLAPVGTDTF